MHASNSFTYFFTTRRLGEAEMISSFRVGLLSEDLKNRSLSPSTFHLPLVSCEPSVGAIPTSMRDWSRFNSNPARPRARKRVRRGPEDHLGIGVFFMRVKPPFLEDFRRDVFREDQAVASRNRLRRQN